MEESEVTTPLPQYTRSRCMVLAVNTSDLTKKLRNKIILLKKGLYLARGDQFWQVIWGDQIWQLKVVLADHFWQPKVVRRPLFTRTTPLPLPIVPFSPLPLCVSRPLPPPVCPLFSPTTPLCLTSPSSLPTPSNPRARKFPTGVSVE